MTFVAEPYERFVDDLLTSLTGGVTREEHRFTGIEESYSLASPGVIAASVKVFGQRQGRGVLFEGGIDYIYDAEQEAIRWKSDGRLPDDQSYFYLSYYLQEGRPRLTDRNPGSVTTTLAESFARELAVLHKQMQMIYESAFVDLAAGNSLDHIAALLALDRKDARFAGGEALFKRGTPAPGDITIPAGTLVSTDQGQNFETTDKRTLRKGQLSVVAPVSAQVEGPDGRVEAGAIKNINRPIFGIESVINEGATFFATQKETDEELRRRIKGTLERAGKATLNAIKFSLIEEIPGINEGNVQVSETADVPGKVEVKFGLGEAVAPELVRRIEESIFNSRAAGVRVVHNLPTRTRSAIAQGTGPGGGVIPREEVVSRFDEKGEPQEAIHLPANIISKMPEGVLNLQIEVLVQLTEKNISASQKENIEDDIRDRVIAYIDALPMGAGLVYNKLLGRIVESEEIRDALLLVRSAPVAGVDAYDIFKSNLATDGRKAKVERQRVFVGLMGESVFLDVLVKLESGPQSDGSGKVTQETDAAIRGAIESALTAARTDLSKTALREAISA
ncbi:MAG: baseplate J/gp47 family protein, partial [Blastocatellia bacterium]|nr:baseplate J/gp47 family protein [Blastocatellia bacterium]